MLELGDDIWGSVGGKLGLDDDDGDEVWVWDGILVEEVDDLEDGILDDVLRDDILVLENEEEDGILALEDEEEDGILVLEDDEGGDILALVYGILVLQVLQEDVDVDDVVMVLDAYTLESE